METLHWFRDIRTVKEADTKKRLWALRLHPDVPGGNAVYFREMLDEYDLVVSAIRSRRRGRHQDRSTETAIVPHREQSNREPQADPPSESHDPFDATLDALVDAGIDLAAQYVATLAKKYVHRKK